MSYQALLFCPDEKTARVVTQVLTELDFTVEPCNETFAAVKKLMAQHYDAIVVDCDNEQNATLLFKSARNSGPNQSSLSVAVVEGQTGVAKAFRIGANLVLTKPINVEQSKGTLRVARGLLRKADAAKPAGSVVLATSVASFDAVRPAAPPSFSEKPITPFPTAVAAQAPGVPDAKASGWEVEEEEGPKPEPVEAALLESISDHLASSEKLTPSPTFSAKESPWQPRPTQEAAGPEALSKSQPKQPAAEKPAFQPLSFGESKKSKDVPAFSSTASGMGSAAAPAPAKEISRPASKPTEAKVATHKAAEADVESDSISTTAPVVEPPMFSALAVKDHEATPEGGSKKPLLSVVAAVLLIAAGYVGYTRLHKPAEQPVPQQPAVQQPVSQVPTPAPAPTPVTAVPTETPSTQPAATAPVPSQIIAPDTTHSVQSGAAVPTASKPTPATKISASEPTLLASTKTAPTNAPTPQPIVVKTQAPKPAAPKLVVAEAAQPTAPGALGIGANSDEKAIAGIMSSTPVAVPKPAGQTLRISQGVSQGLLMKRVQPSYPPQAMQMRLQGAVLLEAMIGKDGSITSVKRISGDALLARSAADAVKQWKYKPYYLNGEPVEIDTQITVNFKLP